MFLMIVVNLAVKAVTETFNQLRWKLVRRMSTVIFKMAKQQKQIWLISLINKYSQFVILMEISNLPGKYECFHEQVIEQQLMLISVLKEQIMRLQARLIEVELDLNHKDRQYEQAQQEIQMMKDKIESLNENNQSIMQTFKVFQREFVKRDYNITPMSPTKQKKSAPETPLFIELIRNIRVKFSEAPADSADLPNTLQKSYLAEHYGFFLHTEVQQAEHQLYNECSLQKSLKPTKIRSYGKKNYFNQKFRHYFWFHIMPNTLKISHKLYEFYLDKYDSNRENEIRKNLRRMDFKIDEDKSESIKLQVKKCLEIFKMYRPDIGYVQGMSYLAWMFLIRLEGYQSFLYFSNLVLCDPFVYSLYMFKSENIKKIISFFLECLQDKKPKISKHMKNLMVQPELFIIEWAYTMFSRAFSLRVSSKIWDLWFCEGFNVFFKVTMVIIEMLEAEIMEQKQNDRIIELLRTKTHRLDEKEFLKNLQKQRLFEDLKL